MKRWLGWLGVGILLFGAGAGVGWALTLVLTPADDVLAETEYTFVAVTDGEVGASITLNAVASWTAVPTGSNQAAGIVTEVVVTPGDEVGQGSILYTVGLRPVVAAHGEVPAFRDIGKDAEGPDVRQLQSMLSALDFYRFAVDGKAGDATVEAIRLWQKSLDLEPTGVVSRADVIFIPSLPSRVSLDPEQISRGATLSGGENLIRALPTTPSFTMPVTETQARMIGAGTEVLISGPDGVSWTALVDGYADDVESGAVTIKLAPVDGDSICGDECARLPVTGDTRLSSEVITAPTVSGLVVPSAAIVTASDGTTAVVSEAGDRIPIEITASARGMSVIEGADLGTRVRIPASATSGTP